MGQLIINGDDFGISSETNHAILRAHERGILTSASLMVNGSAFEEAVAMAKVHPRLSVGIHLVLLQGKATLPMPQIPGLVSEDGTFRSHPIAGGLAYFFWPSLASQIRSELEAQIQKFLSTGIPLSHVNGHLHIHVHPTVLPIVIALAHCYGIKAMRLPREELWLNLRLDPKSCASKLTQWVIFALLVRASRSRLAAAGIKTPERSYGLLQSGRMHKAYLAGLLEKIGDRTCEISFHLGKAADWPPDYDGQRELSALLSPSMRERLQRHQLIAYSDL